MSMTNDCRIEPAGSYFIVIDPWGDRLVHDYATAEAAEREIERCRREDAMWETAKLLVDIAIKAHMDVHNVDQKTASYWIRSALC
jgi:hypothetical protein